MTPVTTFGLITGDQVFESETYHAPPTAHMTDLIQENLMGVARAPTGEVHIRSMDGKFICFIDGIPVPLGVFGGLNDEVDPKVIERSTFIDGGCLQSMVGKPQQSSILKTVFLPEDFISTIHFWRQLHCPIQVILLAARSDHCAR